MKTSFNIYATALVALGLILMTWGQPAQGLPGGPGGPGGPTTRTWVSGTGSDRNPCSAAYPCATFAAALAQTLPGGEIDALDSGDFGPVTIHHAVTIDGSDTESSIVSATTGAISVVAGAGDVVTLRHLSLGGGGSSFIGIAFNSGGALIVDGCAIAGYGGAGGTGIFLGSNSGNALVQKTVISSCYYGINVNGPGQVCLRDVTTQGGFDGLDVFAGATDLSRSLLAQNSRYGLSAAVGGTISASGCTVSGNGTGVSAVNGGLIRLSHNAIWNNGTGIEAIQGGGVSTAGNNPKAGNATPGAPTPGRVIVQE